MKRRQDLDCLEYLTDVLFQPSNGFTPSFETETPSGKESGAARLAKRESHVFSLVRREPEPLPE